MKPYLLLTIAIFMVFLSSCQKDDDIYENKVFIGASSKVDEILIKAGVSDLTPVFNVAIAKLENRDITVQYKVDESLVSVYNSAYYDDAVMLPAANYAVDGSSIEIKAGNVSSPEVEVNFYALDELDRDIVYVLPVTIASANIDILQSAKTIYYVIKGAALINIVADIEDNHLEINWTNPQVCNDLTQLTMEALIRVRDYDRMISTVMGIEGKFLIRLGDASFPPNQIQVSTNKGNFPDSDVNKGLPTNEWVHIALTYDSNDGRMVVYVNGKKQSESIKLLGSVNLGIGGSNGFCIGRSYSDDRYLAGDFSECRIWNVVRTAEEIEANPYYVDPDSEGLVAYWKFNDDSTFAVEDYSGNNNHAVAQRKQLSWKSVSLPE